jgi:hypothetical protein
VRDLRLRDEQGRDLLPVSSVRDQRRLLVNKNFATEKGSLSMLDSTRRKRELLSDLGEISERLRRLDRRYATAVRRYAEAPCPETLRQIRAINGEAQLLGRVLQVL